LPLFDELSDPLTVALLAAEAEEAGWHGVFVWVAGMAGQRQAAPPSSRLQSLVPGEPRAPDQLAEIVVTIAQLRQHTTAPHDIVVGLPLGVDPVPYVKAGAT
jgi:hypothetical protein